MRRLTARAPRSVLPLAVLALALSACRGSTAPVVDIGAARERWERNAPADYTITITRGCECLDTGPVDVRVRGGVIQSRTNVMTGQLLEAEVAALFPDVDGLFDIMEDARARKAYALTVDFDPTRGYPRRVAIDYDAQMADDEITYSVESFRTP